MAINTPLPGKPSQKVTFFTPDPPTLSAALALTPIDPRTFDPPEGEVMAAVMGRELSNWKVTNAMAR